jgi:hypothetical protein
MANRRRICRQSRDGKRPQFEASFPPLLRLLIEGCWSEKQSERLRFDEILALLTDPNLDWLKPPQVEPMESYENWLSRVGVSDKKKALHEYDVREGKDPLGRLVEQLVEEEEDFTEMLEDLFEGDEEMQAKFTAEVVALSTPGGQAPGAEDHQDVQTAQQQLLAMLPKTGLEEQLAQAMEELRTKDMMLEENAAELRLKNAELALSRTQTSTHETSTHSDGALYYRSSG